MLAYTLICFSLSCCYIVCDVHLRMCFAEDAYEIEEICLSAGDVNDQTYAMSASVMDGVSACFYTCTFLTSICI